MEKFLRECLSNLESLTGIRQLYFLEQDQDGERKICVLIKGMIVVCGQFDYIPEKDQQKIISDMMISDQNYDALNSRTLHKWLNLYKDVYWTRANSQQQEEETNPLEPLKPETLKMIAEFQGKLLEKETPKFPGLDMTMEQIKYEDSMRLKGELDKPKGIIDTRPTFTVYLTDDDGNPVHTIEGVRATSQEKANEAVVTAIKQGDLKL